MRTTHSTSANDQSSRSHAVYQINVHTSEKAVAKLLLVDLSGTEWHTEHYDKARRQESAEINKSLMALKECIRALDNKAKHVPFRGSKMTMMLKDSFVNENAKVIMIVTVAPTMSSSDHTLITLRYATSFRENQSKLIGHVVKKHWAG